MIDSKFDLLGKQFVFIISFLVFLLDKVQLKVRGEPTPCSNVKLERYNISLKFLLLIGVGL